MLNIEIYRIYHSKIRAKINEYIKKGDIISTIEEFDLLIPNPIQEKEINGDMNSEHMSQVDYDETHDIMNDPCKNKNICDDEKTVDDQTLNNIRCAETNYEEVEDAVDAVILDEDDEDDEDDKDDEDDEDDESDRDGEENQEHVVDGYFFPSCKKIITTNDSTYARKNERLHGKFCRTCKTEITRNHIQKVGNINYCTLLKKDNTEGGCKHV